MAGRTLAFSVGVAALLFAGGGVRAVEPQAPGAAATASASTGQALLDQYCLTCHNERIKAGGLRLASADIARVADNAELWEKVVRKLRARAMPPALMRSLWQVRQY